MEDDPNVDYEVPIYVSLWQLYKVCIIFSFKNQSDYIHIHFSVCHLIVMKNTICSSFFEMSMISLYFLKKNKILKIIAVYQLQIKPNDTIILYETLQ